MPSRWTVRLPRMDATRVTPEQVHAVVSGWFDTAPGAHEQQRKAYSVSLPRPTGDHTVIGIGLVDDRLVDPLHTGAGRGRRLRFGSQTTVLDRDPCQTHGIPWAELNKPSAATSWSLRFVTLTTFRRGNAFTPNPGLKPILGSLRQVWRASAPPELPPLVLELTPEPVWLTAIDVSSRTTRVNDLLVSGFTGRLRFACDGPPAVVAAVDRLVRLSAYAGVGAYTTRGFGVVRVESTDRSPRLQPSGSR